MLALGEFGDPDAFAGQILGVSLADLARTVGTSNSRATYACIQRKKFPLRRPGRAIGIVATSEPGIGSAGAAHRGRRHRRGRHPAGRLRQVSLQGIE